MLKFPLFLFITFIFMVIVISVLALLYEAMGDFGLNTLIIIASVAVVNFVVGALWYSPILFARIWMRLNNLSSEDVQTKPKQMIGLMLTSAIFALLQATLIISIVRLIGIEHTVFAVMSSIAISGCYALVSQCKTSMFGKRPLEAALLDGGYEIVAATLSGIAAIVLLGILL